LKQRKELLAALFERAKTKSDINEHLELLYKMVADTGVQNIVELGARGGNSTVALVIGAAETRGHVTSVDHGKGAEYAGEPSTWDTLSEASAAITDRLGLGDFWTLVIKDDLQYAKEYDGEIDLLMIDTEHSYDQTKKELASWGAKVVDGGFIAIHDTVSFPEQNKAIWEFLDEHPLSHYVEHKNCNGLGIIIKDIRRRAGAATHSRADNTVLQERIRRMQEDLLGLRSKLAQKEKEFLLRLEEQKLEFKKQLPVIKEEHRREFESQFIQSADDPLSALLLMYRTRPDIRAAFPEVDQGNYLRLLQWAQEYVATRKDAAHQTLRSHLSWYGGNSLLTLSRDNVQLKKKLENLTASLEESAAEISRMQMKLAARQIAYENKLAEISRSKDNEIAALQSVSRSKDNEIAALQSQLRLIVSSTTWRLVELMKRLENRYLPPGSRRGRQFQRLIKAANKAVSKGLD